MVKILLVEDSELGRDMLSRRLVRRGFEVVTAIDGAAGLALANGESPDLILLDMGLPVIDGWECARRLKAAPATSAIPIIALTAHTDDDDEERTLAAGCNAFHPKHAEFAELVQKIDALIAGIRGGEERS